MQYTLYYTMRIVDNEVEELSTKVEFVESQDKLKNAVRNIKRRVAYVENSLEIIENPDVSELEEKVEAVIVPSIAQVIREIKDVTNVLVETFKEPDYTSVKDEEESYNINRYARKFDDVLWVPAMRAAEYLMIDWRQVYTRIYRKYLRKLTYDNTIYVPLADIQAWHEKRISKGFTK